MHRIVVYCPCCGETFVAVIDDLAPGDIELTCDKCGTEWIIRIQFYERGAND